MVKADLVLPDGTKVVIEGAADEVAGLLERFSASPKSGSGSASRKKPSQRSQTEGSSKRKKVAGAGSLINELAEEDYFNVKRTIGDVQKKLEERGHIFALGSISPALFRLTRKRTIRRVKEGKVWVYVK